MQTAIKPIRWGLVLAALLANSTAMAEVTAPPDPLVPSDLTSASGGEAPPSEATRSTLDLAPKSPARESVTRVGILLAQLKGSEAPADRALIEPLLRLQDVNAPLIERQAAAEKLAALGDDRAVIPLVYALQDAEVTIQVAVVKALGSYVLPETEQALERVLKGTYPTPVRTAAADSLGAQRTLSAREVLLEVYRRERNPREVRAAAWDALDVWFPGYLASIGETGKVIDSRGRWLLVPAAVGFGAYDLGAVGRLGASSASLPIGIASGALLGGASAFLLTQRQEMTPVQAASIVTGGAWGLWGGYRVGTMATFHRCDSEQQTLDGLAIGTPAYDSAYQSWWACAERTTDIETAVGALGNAVGIAATSLTLKHNPYAFYDVLDINLGGLAAHNALLGTYGLVAPDAQPSVLTHGSLLGISLAGMVGTALVTRNLHFSPGDVALTAHGTLQGGWVGGWLPSLFWPASDLRSTRSNGGVYLGSSLGMVGAAWLAQKTDLTVGQNLFMGATSAYGYALGASIPRLADSSSEKGQVGSMLAGGLVGLGASALLRERVKYDFGDVTLVALGTGWGLWQSIGISGYLANRGQALITPTQSNGARLLGPAVGGLGMMALSQRMELSPWEVLMLASGGVWGGWYAGWGAMLFDVNTTDTLLATVLASDLGLVTSAVLLSPLVGIHPTHLGFVNLGGLAGTALFSLGAALATSNTDTIITANLLGGTVGLATGAFIATRVKVDKMPKAPKQVGLALQRLGRWHPQLGLEPNVTYLEGQAPRTDGWRVTLRMVQPVP